MRLRHFINENNIKSGSWVKGEGETLFGNIMVYGIFVSKTSNNLALIATWIQKGKVKKKIYTQISDVKLSTKQSEAPKDLLSFAQKHSMYGNNK